LNLLAILLAIFTVSTKSRSTKVHGTIDADVANEAPFREIAARLAGYLKYCDLCGYNIWSFDLKILVAEFRRAGVPFSLEVKSQVPPRNKSISTVLTAADC
jgi:DNA polymerase III epsilon subunit-like protein